MPPPATFSAFHERLAECAVQVEDFLNRASFGRHLSSPHLERVARSYLQEPGKRLRPAILLTAYNAVGGDTAAAVPAAAAVELFHTWTLVHDDLIDHDSLRRGAPTAHILGTDLAGDAFPHLSVSERAGYGEALAILAGDVQHGWALRSLLECARRDPASAPIVLCLADRLESWVLEGLLAGEALDVQYSHTPVHELCVAQILEMLELKTARLFQFAGVAGVCLGRRISPDACPLADAISAFCRGCGIAFQLQDDILGLTGDEQRLGKPVGSDLREGKRTVLVCHAWNAADTARKRVLERVLGRSDATPADLVAARAVIEELGSVAFTRNLAREYVQDSLDYLNVLPRSSHQDVLLSWAHFMLERDE